MTPLTFANASQRTLDTLKAGNVRARDSKEGRVCVVESTANDGACDALGAVKSETRSDAAECPDMIEARMIALRCVVQSRA